MKIAQLVFAITAITCVVTIFNLASSGDLHPFFARVYLGIVYATWIFLALLPYHFKKPTK
jgi:hypothetical protein